MWISHNVKFSARTALPLQNSSDHGRLKKVVKRRNRDRNATLLAGKFYLQPSFILSVVPKLLVIRCFFFFFKYLLDKDNHLRIFALGNWNTPSSNTYHCSLFYTVAGFDNSVIWGMLGSKIRKVTLWPFQIVPIASFTALTDFFFLEKSRKVQNILIFLKVKEKPISRTVRPIRIH